jgi:hypothetical protein
VWVRARLCKLQKRVHSIHSRSDKVYQLFHHGRWFSPGTPASSTTKTDRHDIAEILLKVRDPLKLSIEATKGSIRNYLYMPLKQAPAHGNIRRQINIWKQA